MTHEIMTSYGLSTDKGTNPVLSWMSSPWPSIDLPDLKKNLAEIGWKEFDEPVQEYGSFRSYMFMNGRRMSVLLINDGSGLLWRVIFSVSS